jgi:hypothetical protein
MTHQPCALLTGSAPNKGVQAATDSVRSCLAPPVCRA